MEQRFRPLIPAPPPKAENHNLPTLARSFVAPLPPRRNRVGVPAACELCRKKKSRCDGQRPACERCRSDGLECLYATAQGETHHTALKRKYQHASEENRQLRELFSLIHQRPAIEASEIYRRIRGSDDPIEVLHLVKEADLLLPLMASSGLHEVKEGPQGDHFFQLPARPWSVAGTDRIVPELMTNLFLKRSILNRALNERLALNVDDFDSMSID